MKPNVLFFMTPGVDLDAWKQIGSIERELKLYRRYRQLGCKLSIIEFGKSYREYILDKLKIVSYPKWMPLVFLPFVCYRHMKTADICKTNQSLRSWLFVLAARIWQKPIMLRCGYVHGEYLETTRAAGIFTEIYKVLEGWAFRNATHCTVTSEPLASWLSVNYRVPETRVDVIPNFVDTALFRPMSQKNKSTGYSVISVGRLHPVKRFDLLIEACSLIKDCSLTIIGEGLERNRLRVLASERGVILSLPGNVPHVELPVVLNSHHVFAITSLWEGHPKSLLEAMACGMPCICVDAPGVRELVAHCQNGFVCQAKPEDISKAILAGHRECDVGLRAREFAEQRFGFEKIANAEQTLIYRMIRQWSNRKQQD